MKKLKSAGTAALVLMLWLSAEASAFQTANPALICNSCPNPVIYQRLREQFGPYTTRYVLDFDQNTIRLFTRQGNRNWREIPVADAERNYFNLLTEFRRKNGGDLVYLDRIRLTGTIDHLGMQPVDPHALKRNVTAVSDFDAVSAWEVADSGYYRNMVADYLNATHGSLWARIAGNVHMALASVRTLFGAGSANEVRLGVRELAAQMEVSFRDGSRSLFTWDPYKQAFTYIPGSSLDSDNNTIPDNVDDVTGGRGNIRRYNFSGTPGGVNNAFRFNRRVLLWGVSTPPAGAPAVLACTQVDGGPRVCHLQR